MEKDRKLDRLCKEFVTLDAGEKDYIIGISKALAFSVRRTGERQGGVPENPKTATRRQGGVGEEGGRCPAG